MTQQPGVARAAPAEDLALLDAIKRGDERAFEELVERLGRSLQRVAAIYVRDPAVAEEVVQETWIGFLEGIDRFEGRASLKTWIFRILINSAKKRLASDRRSIPFSALDRLVDAEAAVDPDRFFAPGERWEHHWSSPPSRWDGLPPERLLSKEALSLVERAIDGLPPSQREVITLRDVEGWTAQEVCNVLGLTETNQRVLLHRARSKVRRALERYLDDKG